MGEGRGLGGEPVIRAAPRGEVQLPRLAVNPPNLEVVHQRRDRLGGQRSREELRLAEWVPLLRPLTPPRPSHLVAELGQVPLRLPVGHVRADRRGGVRARAGDQLAEQRRGGGLGAEHGSEQMEHGPLAGVAGGGYQQAGREFIGRSRRPGLPGLDHLGRVDVWPNQVETGGGRRRHSAEGQRRDHAEVAATCAAQRPEQLGLAVVVAVDNPPVGQNHLRADQMITGQPVNAAEDSESAAKRQAGDPDRRAAAGRDRKAMRA